MRHESALAEQPAHGAAGEEPGAPDRRAERRRVPRTRGGHPARRGGRGMRRSCRWA
ncbi:MAG: hypothetical protein MZW92_36970 [Comamonadaceae bacterium]|nr:hypothetical protein [Comamonadaceae bacterium]